MRVSTSTVLRALSNRNVPIRSRTTTTSDQHQLDSDQATPATSHTSPDNDTDTSNRHNDKRSSGPLHRDPSVGGASPRGPAPPGD
jgi:hypothetical protein